MTTAAVCYLYPVGSLGRLRHIAADPAWAQHTDLAFARTLCGQMFATPAGVAEYRLDTTTFPDTCRRCANAAGRAA